MMANTKIEEPSDNDDCDDLDKTKKSFGGKLVKVGGDDGQQYLKQLKMLYWNFDTR